MWDPRTKAIESERVELALDRWERNPLTRKLIWGAQPPNKDKLNKRWLYRDIVIDWLPLWKLLWSGWGLARAQLICWRVIPYAYYTNSWGARWSVTEDRCPCCTSDGEDTNHLFFDCPQLQIRCIWALVVGLVSHTNLQSMVRIRVP